MRTLLIINASLGLQNSFASGLVNYFQEKWQEKFSDDHIMIRNIGDGSVPHLTEDTIEAVQSASDEIADTAKSTRQLSDQFIAELQLADILLFSVPMHNYSIPSSLKAYIDHVTRPTKTFMPSTRGNRGMLKNKSAVVITTSGGSSQTTKYDFQGPYLQEFLNLIGIRDIIFVRAQNLYFFDKSIPEAKKTIDKYIQTMPLSQHDVKGWLPTLLNFVPSPTLLLKLAALFPKPDYSSICESHKDFYTTMLRFQSSKLWPIHPIEYGFGQVNIDYYPIVIHLMPYLPGQKARATAKELFDYWRVNFNNFIDTQLSYFEPYDETASVWTSENYLGSIVHINLVPQMTEEMREMLGDVGKYFNPSCGTMVVSDVNPTAWTFSTIWTPRDLSHPVSGHRQFGYFKEPDSYVFYTRAIDRVTGVLPTLIDNVAPEKIFRNGEKLWRSLQIGMQKFVVDNGGMAEILHHKTISKRHSWEALEADFQINNNLITVPNPKL